MQIKDFYLFGVCDGHGNLFFLILGINGHFASNHVKNYLPANLQLIDVNKILHENINFKKYNSNDSKIHKKIRIEEIKIDVVDKSNFKQFYEKNFDKLLFSQGLDSDKEVASIISESFQKTHEDILERSFDVNLSGTTVCSIFILGQTLYCANVGDSRSIIGQLNNDKTFKHLQISRDHKPDDKEEQSRIIQNGGRVESYKGENDEDIGPARVWLKDEDLPGLAMSRSIGDLLAARVGVLYEPEIFQFKLTKNDKFIIIASDGLWEFVTNEHAVKIVAKYLLSGDTESAVEELIKVATEFWEEVI